MIIIYNIDNIQEITIYLGNLLQYKIKLLIFNFDLSAYRILKSRTLLQL